MSIGNPSFENEGARKGTALSWGFGESTQFVDVAEFGALCGYERFEMDWRLPLGLNIQDGFVSNPHAWATLTDGTTPSIGAAPTSEFVSSPAVVVQSGVIPADAVITLVYTNQDGSPSRIGTITIPADEDGGHAFYFLLEGLDSGFQSIQDISSSIPLPGTILAVVGSWLKVPLNQSFKEVFADVDLDIAEFSVDVPHEDFEGGWSNDVGKLDSFEALLTEAASFDTAAEAFEDYEEGWQLPNFGVVPFNEDRRFAHEAFIDGDLQSLEDDAYSIVLDVNDKIAMRWQNGGTFANLLVTLDPGDYSIIHSKLICVPGSALVDGDTFTIDNGTEPPATFEFDDNASVAPGNFAIPFTAAMTTNDVRDAIVSAINTLSLTNVSAETIPTAGIVKVLSEAGATHVITEAVAAAGFLVITTIFQEVQAKVRAALDVDTGSVDGVDFASSRSPDNRLRLETLAAGDFPMELLDPGGNSAWPTLGFVPSVSTERRLETLNLSSASFDTTPEGFENFEEEWRDNETSIFAFGGGDLEAATFDPGAKTAEDFETDWVLTL